MKIKLSLGLRHHSDLRDYAAGVYLSDIYVWRMAIYMTKTPSGEQCLMPITRWLFVCKYVFTVL